MVIAFVEKEIKHKHSCLKPMKCECVMYGMNCRFEETKTEGERMKKKDENERMKVDFKKKTQT